MKVLLNIIYQWWMATVIGATVVLMVVGYLLLLVSVVDGRSSVTITVHDAQDLGAWVIDVNYKGKPPVCVANPEPFYNSCTPAYSKGVLRLGGFFWRTESDRIHF